ncbi:MAG: hypothetical protein GPJ54_05055 [Candidatus Heimdallarchaeota archaeon]|nr:hypothetical protein [Candidatus Heimdallarchaeota archaeon]
MLTSLDHYFFNDQIHSPLKFRDLVLLSIGVDGQPLNTQDAYERYKRLVLRFSEKFTFSTVKIETYTRMVSKLVTDGTLVKTYSPKIQGYFVKLSDQGEGEYDLLQLSLTTYRQIFSPILST